MRQFIILFFIGVTLLVISGCALQKDLYSLESRQTQLERRTLRMEKKVGSSIRSQIEEVVDSRQDEVKKMRNQYASIKAEVESLRDEVKRLRGSLEEVQFKKSKNANDTGQSDQKASKEVGVLTTDMEQIKKRLSQLETYLDLETVQIAKKEAEEGSGAGQGEGTGGPASMSDDMALYTAAKAEFDQGRMYEARSGFSKLLKDYPESSHADNAQFWIGETYYQQKWYEKAILEYEEVIKKYPKGNKVPAALLKQAYAFQKIGDKPNAELILKELVKKYPKSSEGKVAQGKLKEF